jgi:endoglucanase
LRNVVFPFYCSYSGYQDELLWGAAWLHKATKNPMYLNYIQVNGQVLGAAEFDNFFRWDNKHVGARILLSKAFLFQKVQSLHDYKATRVIQMISFVLLYQGPHFPHPNIPQVGFYSR